MMHITQDELYRLLNVCVIDLTSWREYYNNVTEKEFLLLLHS